MRRFELGQPVIWIDFDGRTWPARVTAVGVGRVRSQLDGGQPDAGVSRTFTLWERQWQCGCMTMTPVPCPPNVTESPTVPDWASDIPLGGVALDPPHPAATLTQRCLRRQPPLSIPLDGGFSFGRVSLAVSPHA